MSSVEILHYVTKSVTFVFISLKLVASFFSWEQKFSFVGLDFIMEGMVSPVLGGVMVSPWGGEVYCTTQTVKKKFVCDFLPTEEKNNHMRQNIAELVPLWTDELLKRQDRGE